MADRLVQIVRGTEVATVPEENLAKAEAQGWSVETERQRRVRELSDSAGISDMIQTGVESAVSTATLGGYDVLASELGGDQYRENRSIKEEAMPGASVIGTGLGVAIPAILSGGTSGAAAGAAKGAASAGARGGASLSARALFGSAAEATGAVGAAGKAAALASAPARGAMALGRVAESGVASGLGRLGVTGETIGGRALLTGSKYAAAGATEGALFGAGQALSEAALAPGGDYEHLAEKMLAGAGDGALMGALGGAAAGIGVGAVGAVGSKLVAKLGKADFGEIAAENAVHALRPSKRAMRELSNTNSITKVGRKLMDEDIVAAGRSFDDMLERAQSVRQRSGKTIGDTLETLDKQAGFVDGADIVAAIRSQVRDKADSVLRSDRVMARRLENEVADVVGLAETGTLTHSELHAIRRRVDSKINWAAPELKDWNEQLTKIRGTLEDSLEKSIETETKSRGLEGLYENYSQAKESFKAARWAEKQLAEQVEVSSFSNRFLSLTDNIHGAAGLAAGLASGSVGLGVLTHAAVSTGHKYLREHGRSIIADLANRAAKIDMKIGTAMRRFFRKPAELRHAAAGELVEIDSVLGKRARESRADAFQRVASKIQKAAPPTAMVLDAEAPETAKAARTVNARALDFLRSKLPQSAGPPNPFYEQPPPHPDAIAQFARYFQAVKDPMGVLDSLENGTLTSEEAEAIRTVYPKLYQQMRDVATDWFDKAGGKMRFADRVSFGVLLQLPVDPSLDPQSIQITQEIMRTSREPTQPAGGGSPPQMGSLSDEFETLAQQLEKQEAVL